MVICRRNIAFTNPINMRKYFSWWLIGLLGLSIHAFALGADAGRTTLHSAIAPVTLGKDTAGITRRVLTTHELVSPYRASFTLKLRNMDELRARVERGEVLTVAELIERHFPRPEDHRRVERWARAQGLEIGPSDCTRLAVAVQGSVARLQEALQMQFARIRDDGGTEYTSAVTPPSIPTDLIDCILTVSGLQPHLKPRSSLNLDIRQTTDRYILPHTFAQLYRATNLGLDGTGQTIAILGANRVNPEDLKLFWHSAGLSVNIEQYREVAFNDGTSPGDYTKSGEETMDLQWAGAMAPGAKLVLFTSLSLNSIVPWVVAEFDAGRPIHQMSSSYGLPEASMGEGARGAGTQYYAVLAALGVSFFAASGDDGSTQTIVNGVLTYRGYDPDGVASPWYPASDPYVTGVGGTTVGFAYDAQGLAANPVREGAWSLPNLPGPTLLRGRASGGGVSWYFDRPAWQTGPNLPAGNKRLVPDVAALASSNFPPYREFYGMRMPAGGTSLSSPIWAGLAALINQARAEKGLGPIGLLGPRLYPLIGTGAFNQMTTGSQSAGDGFSETATNGAYAVGPNFNLLSGLGSPNVEYLVAALTLEEPAPPEPDTEPETPPPTTPSNPTPSIPSPPSSAGGSGGGGGAPSLYFTTTLLILFTIKRLQKKSRPEQ